ncbi:MAG: hypothetical protein JSS87_02925 [Acidobacteria bacterium]|nr:hypothetical protein [Acidobacteriota bacterium]
MTRLHLPKFSLGVGDRFAHQAKAQLQACVLAKGEGVDVTPVWNKSNREHLIIGSSPKETRAAADVAVREFGWTGAYFVDADHINLENFERFLDPCDFFTIDVADQIGTAFNEEEMEKFIGRHPELQGEISIPGIQDPFRTDKAFVMQVAKQFLAAVQHASKIYQEICAKKGEGTFITEISMDETTSPQTPLELLIILAAIADEKVPIQTIAPKFTGRFNKGVDYVGDEKQFAREFRDDLATIAYAVNHYGLPENLKLSVHSGSDKYSIYKGIRAGMQEFNAGVHLKTAGTTWLEELIGLAEAGGRSLNLAKEIYATAYAHADELCEPYEAVIDIQRNKLPLPAEVHTWTSDQFVRALRHDQDDAAYNRHFRQLLHVGFKVAAKLGQRYTDILRENETIVARNVTQNLFERHIRPIFIGS